MGRLNNIGRDVIYYKGFCYQIFCGSKKMISMRVNRVFYEKISGYYNGTFSDFVHCAMREYVEKHFEELFPERF